MVLRIVCFWPFCTVSGPLATSGPPGIGVKTTGPAGQSSPSGSAGCASAVSRNPFVQRQKDALGWLSVSVSVTAICTSPDTINGPLGTVKPVFAGAGIGVSMVSLKDGSSGSSLTRAARERVVRAGFRGYPDFPLLKEKG